MAVFVPQCLKAIFPLTFGLTIAALRSHLRQARVVRADDARLEAEHLITPLTSQLLMPSRESTGFDDCASNIQTRLNHLYKSVRVRMPLMLQEIILLTGLKQEISATADEMR